MHLLKNLFTLVRNSLSHKYKKKDFELYLKKLNKEDLLSVLTSENRIAIEGDLDKLMFIKLNKEFYICYEYLSILLLNMIPNKEDFAKKYYNYNEENNTISFPIDIVDIFIKTLSVKYDFKYIDNNRIYKTLTANDQIYFKINIFKLPDEIAKVLKNKILFKNVKISSHTEFIEIGDTKKQTYVNFKSLNFD